MQQRDMHVEMHSPQILKGVTTTHLSDQCKGEGKKGGEKATSTRVFTYTGGPETERFLGEDDRPCAHTQRMWMSE